MKQTVILKTKYMKFNGVHVDANASMEIYEDGSFGNAYFEFERIRELPGWEFITEMVPRLDEVDTPEKIEAVFTNVLFMDGKAYYNQDMSFFDYRIPDSWVLTHGRSMEDRGQGEGFDLSYDLKKNKTQYKIKNLIKEYNLLNFSHKNGFLLTDSNRTPVFCSGISRDYYHSGLHDRIIEEKSVWGNTDFLKKNNFFLHTFGYSWDKECVDEIQEIV